MLKKAQSPRRLLVFAVVLYWQALLPLQAQVCACTDCPVPMPDGFAGSFSIQVQGADNPVVGQQGQALCKVRLRFEHAYIGDLKITLTSPDGRSVVLVGPVGFFNATNFSEWNVSFVPCSQTAHPDQGFSGNWSNAQGWGALGNYNGSYYPYSGCLEDFNGSPVNGTWTLKVEDLQTGDTGTFLDYELVFCDPDGIECTNCAANAGFLLEPDIFTCTGDTTLHLQPVPVYFDPQKRPPAATYDYTYVISGTGNVILDYARVPDLRTYPPGRYTVCGCSYYKQHLPLFPAPNGLLTYPELATQLNSATPPFCGRMTSRCIGIRIKPQPEDTLLRMWTCAPRCVTFLGQNYCKTGTYTRQLQDEAGCLYTATLELTVDEPSPATLLQDTVCAGECSKLPGFEKACATGIFTDTLQNATGCDSVLILTLLVRDAVLPAPAWASVDSSVCLGDTLRLSLVPVPGATRYLWTDPSGIPFAAVSSSPVLTYPWLLSAGATLCVRAANACTESPPLCAHFTTLQSPPAPVISGPDTVCTNAISRFRVDSLPGVSGVQWTIEGGEIIGPGDKFEIAVRWYGAQQSAKVCATLRHRCGNSPPGCKNVIAETIPALPVLSGDTLLCTDGNIWTEYRVNQSATNYTYQWALSGAGALSAAAGTAQVRWESPGGRLCAAAGGRCGLSTPYCLEVKADAPPVVMAGADADTCGQTLLLQAAHNIGTGIWAVVGAPAGGKALLGKDPSEPYNSLTVDVPGRYRLAWTVTHGACMGSDTVNLDFKAVPAVADVVFECDTLAEHYQVTLNIVQGTPPFNINGDLVTGTEYRSPLQPRNTPYRFLLTDANACAAPKLEGTFQCACLSNAGTMPEVALRICQSDSLPLRIPSDARSDPNDIGCFVLHTRPDDSLGYIWDIGRQGGLRFQGGMEFYKTYYISYVVGNQLNGIPDFTDPCLAVSKGQAVLFLPALQAHAGADTSICGMEYPLQAQADVPGRWSLLDGPPGMPLSFLNGPDDPKSRCRADVPGVYHLVWTVDNGVCRQMDTITVTFKETPRLAAAAPICDSVSEHYKIRLSIFGGATPYLLNNTIWQDTSYESPWLDNNTSYQYQVSDANGCAAPLLAGRHTCPCLSEAGHLDSARILLCAGEMLRLDPPKDAVPDANDKSWFVLHTSPDDPLGTALDIRPTGLFPPPPGLLPGVPYYVSFVVGNPLNGAPDPGYSCLSIAKGPSLVFYPKPVASAGMDQKTCESAVPLQAGASAGTGQWLLDNSALSLAQGTLAATNTVLASAPGKYMVVWEVTNEACSTRDTAELEFYPPVHAALPTVLCDSVAEFFQVQFNIEGGAPPYRINGKESFLNSYTSSPLPSGTAYQFLLSDANGCRDTTMSEGHTCACLSRAGVMARDTLRVCETVPALAQLTTAAQADPNDDRWFVLHTLPNDTLGDILAYNQSGIFQFQTGWQYEKVYYVAHFVGNMLNGAPDWTHPCAGISKGQPLIFYKNTEAYAGPDADTCGLVQMLQTGAVGGAGVWDIIGQPAGGRLQIDSIQVVAGLPGPYRAVWSVSNAACVTRDTVQWLFHPQPVLTLSSVACDSVNQHFQIVCAPSAGTAPYHINGLPVGPTDFVAGPFDSGATYSLQLTDDNGCTAPPLSGQHTCVCSSRAGTLPATPIQICEGETLQAGAPVGEYLDPNDAGVYILHTAAGNTPGKIWGQSLEGRFTFQSGMSYDSVYYLARMVANARNGLPDPNDVCLSVGEGQAVRFLPAPRADIKVTPVRCYGEQNGSISVMLRNGLEPVLAALDNAPLSARTIFNHLAPGLYRLRTEDANGCSWQSEPLDVIEPPRLTVHLPQNRSLSLGDTLLLEASVSPPAALLDTLWWQPLADTLAAHELWQRIAPVRSAAFTLTVVDTAGCMATDKSLVTVQQKRRIYVPNSVALQSGANAGLTVYAGPEAQEVLEFGLYDRWGNQWYGRKNFAPGSFDPALADQLITKKIVPIVLIYKTVILWKDGTQDIFWGDIFLIN